jgi:hypothetical protein
LGTGHRFFVNSGGDAVTAFIDDTAGGATVTTYGGNNLYDLNIYRGAVIVRNDNGGNPAVADFQGSAATYTNLPYDIDTTPKSVKTGYTFYVPSGVTFVPGANFRVGTSGTTSTLKIAGEVQPEGNTLGVYGSITGTGTLTGGAGAITVKGDFAPGTYADIVGSSLTVGGDFAPTVYTSSAGTVDHNGTGTIGSYTFSSLMLSGSGTHTAAGAGGNDRSHPFRRNFRTGELHPQHRRKLG